MDADPEGFEGVPPALAQTWQQMYDRLQDPGPEYLTVKQIATLWQVSMTTTGTRLKDLEKRNLVERRETIRGRWRTSVYKLAAV